MVGLEVGDEADDWRAAGFAVDGAGHCQVGEVTISCIGTAAGRGIRSWTLEGIDTAQLVDATVDGLPLGPPAGLAAPDAVTGAPVHPNGVVTIDHLVLLAPDHGRTTAAFEAVGLPLLRIRETDQYGFPAEQRFFRAGEVLLEVIGPAEPEPGDDRPARFFGLAYTVADLEASASLLGDHLGRRKDAVQTGRRIATLRHRDVGLSVATALMSAAGAPG